MQLAVGIEGFLLALAASGRSDHTLEDYRRSLTKLLAFLGDCEIGEVETEDAQRFLASLRDRLAPKTLRNLHTTLSSFWSWAVATGYAEVHIVRPIAPSKAPPPAIQPFTEVEMRAMLRACDRTASWVSHRSGQETSSTRVTGLRDRAVLLFLVDTGVRASELCELRIEQVALATGTAVVLGKGRRERIVRCGKRVRQALWRYWATREDLEPGAPAFATVLDGERPLTRDVLYRLLARLGERAGVREVFPHRFRHTFAITYLRNGGDIFTLQVLLGHSSLDMVRRYARIADTDTERVHERASPADNWRL